jgi:hypothetical protein
MCVRNPDRPRLASAMRHEIHRTLPSRNAHERNLRAVGRPFRRHVAIHTGRHPGDMPAGKVQHANQAAPRARADESELASIGRECERACSAAIMHQLFGRSRPGERRSPYLSVGHKGDLSAFGGYDGRMPRCNPSWCGAGKIGRIDGLFHGAGDRTCGVGRRTALQVAAACEDDRIAVRRPGQLAEIYPVVAGEVREPAAA